ncbi:MAG: 30S ribosomal protein S8 [Candidatus Woesearchaeota archaeon]
MLNDPLSNVLSTILSYEKIGKRSVLLRPASKMVKAVLDLLNKEGYVGSYETESTARGGLLKLNLLGQINKCGVVKPRFSVKKNGFEKFERRYLPARGMGILIVSTQKGLMSHEEAKRLGLGGKLIAYCY